MTGGGRKCWIPMKGMGGPEFGQVQGRAAEGSSGVGAFSERSYGSGKDAGSQRYFEEDSDYSQDASEVQEDPDNGEGC